MAFLAVWRALPDDLREALIGVGADSPDALAHLVRDLEEAAVVVVDILPDLSVEGAGDYSLLLLDLQQAAIRPARMMSERLAATTPWEMVVALKEESKRVAAVKRPLPPVVKAGGGPPRVGA